MCEKMPFNVDLNQINNNENEKKKSPIYLL
jgi:hypothetical protein